MSSWNELVLAAVLRATLWSAAGMVALLLLARRRGVVGVAPTVGVLAGVLLLTLTVALPRPTILLPTAPVEAAALTEESTAPSADAPRTSVAMSTFGRLFVAVGSEWTPMMPRYDWMQVACWTWLSLACLGAARLLVAFAEVWSVRRRSRAVDDAELIAEVREAAAAVGAPRNVELRVDATIASPAAMGWLRATILLPADWRSWSAVDRAAVLKHELAHLASRDCLTSLAAQCALALHLYHPLVHWLVRRLHAEQEHAADLRAALGVGGAPYVRMLSRFALRRDRRRMWAPARGLTAAPASISWRIAMLERNLTSRRPAGRLLGLAAFAAALVVAFCPRAEYAAAEPPKAEVKAKAEATASTSAPKAAPVGCAVLRPAALLGLKSMADYKTMLKTMFAAALPEMADFSPEMIEEVTGQVFLSAKTKDHQGTLQISGTYMKLVAGETWMKHLAKFSPKTKKEANGWTYCTIAMDKVPATVRGLLGPMKEICFWLVDDRTLVGKMDYKSELPQMDSWTPMMIESWNRSACFSWFDANQIAKVLKDDVSGSEFADASRQMKEVLALCRGASLNIHSTDELGATVLVHANNAANLKQLSSKLSGYWRQIPKALASEKQTPAETELFEAIGRAGFMSGSIDGKDPIVSFSVTSKQPLGTVIGVIGAALNK